MTPTPPHAPRQARSQRTRTRILEATLQLLARAPLAELTLERIAEAADLSVGAIYRHFAGRQELLAALLAWLQARSTASLADELRAAEAERPGLAARVDFLIDRIAAAYRMHRQLTQALLASRITATPQDTAAQHTQSAAQVEALVGWLLACRDEIAHADPAQALRIGLHCTLHTLQAALLLDDLPAGVDEARLADQLKRMLLAYLRGG